MDSIEGKYRDRVELLCTIGGLHCGISLYNSSIFPSSSL